MIDINEIGKILSDVVSDKQKYKTKIDILDSLISSAEQKLSDITISINNLKDENEELRKRIEENIQSIFDKEHDAQNSRTEILNLRSDRDKLDMLLYKHRGAQDLGESILKLCEQNTLNYVFYKKPKGDLDSSNVENLLDRLNTQ